MSEGFVASPIVFVIDDDASVRTSLKELLESVGLRVELFDSADAFLTSRPPEVASCLVLDVRLPGRSGLEFQTDLMTAGISLPIIFITGHGDIPMSVRAMKSGAVEFLTKPFRDQDLLEAVRAAIERDRARREEENSIAALRTRFALLTAREKEVIAYVSAGFVNKRIAAEMDISEVTVKVHRRNIMQKMSARSLAELVRMADLLGVRRVVSKAH
jgi:FixJ family two-component response regulator